MSFQWRTSLHLRNCQTRFGQYLNENPSAIQKDKDFYLEEDEDDKDDITPYNFATDLQYYFYFVKGTNVV